MSRRRSHLRCPEHYVNATVVRPPGAAPFVALAIAELGDRRPPVITALSLDEAEMLGLALLDGAEALR